jgi:hypothetical protein
MTVLAECCREPLRQRNVTDASILWSRQLPPPIRLLYAQLPLVEIYVAPFESNHLTTPQSCLTPSNTIKWGRHPLTFAALMSRSQASKSRGFAEKCTDFVNPEEG